MPMKYFQLLKIFFEVFIYSIFLALVDNYMSSVIKGHGCEVLPWLIIDYSKHILRVKFGLA